MVFLLLNACIGVQFYLFVRYYETGGLSIRAARPAGVEGWLPIASLMNLKVLLLTGTFARHSSGWYSVADCVPGSVLVFRKSFCGWLCPVGAVSEYLWRIGRKLFRRNFRLPRSLDIPLRGMKYILMGLFVYVVVSMPVRCDPAVSGKLLRHGGRREDAQFLSSTGHDRRRSVMAVLMLGSIFVQNFWCRYFCPYGALMGLVSLVSPLRIRRQSDLCIDCAKCAKACPSALPVDRLVTIRSAECIGCMQCVAACPAEGALFLSLWGNASACLPGRLPPESRHCSWPRWLWPMDRPLEYESAGLRLFSTHPAR